MEKNIYRLNEQKAATRVRQLSDESLSLVSEIGLVRYLIEQVANEPKPSPVILQSLTSTLCALAKAHELSQRRSGALVSSGIYERQLGIAGAITAEVLFERLKGTLSEFEICEIVDAIVDRHTATVSELKDEVIE